MGFRAAGFLQHRVDVDSVLGKDRGQTRDDAGAVFHHKAQVMLGSEVGSHGWILVGGSCGMNIPGLFGAGNRQDVGDNCYGRGMSSSSVTAEDSLTAVSSRRHD